MKSTLNQEVEIVVCPVTDEIFIVSTNKDRPHIALLSDSEMAIIKKLRED